MYFPGGFTTIEQVLKALHTKPERYWIERGERRALGLFHQMAERVPAYKDFLKKNKVNPDKIKTIHDFGYIPSVSKDSYLKKYPLEKLCWDGKLKQRQWTISTTSGSTGVPFYFPREQEQDWQYAFTAELYLRTNYQIHKRSTLYIDAFPMGPWIGGVFTYEAIRLVAERGKYPLSIITTGINKTEIIKAVQRFGRSFDQILIGSYGPFLKDTLDEGKRQGVRWRDYNLGFIFSAEGFSETFRDYVLHTAGLAGSFTATLNHYGTVDLGTMAHETPLSVLLRRQALKHPSLYKYLFRGSNKLPTLCQYMPEMFYFEDINGDLYCSAYSGIPLVRYNLKDHGGVWSSTEALTHFKSLRVDVSRELSSKGIDSTLWNLPLVYVYERSDFSVSFYAFIIYPETIRKALDDRMVGAFISGKFTMMVEYNKQKDQVLQIHVELKPGIKESERFRDHITQAIVRSLLRDSSEYYKTYQEIGERAHPQIIFWPYEHSTYFTPGVKQKWVVKPK